MDLIFINLLNNLNVFKYGPHIVIIMMLGFSI
jgi:hypothetical protein